MALLDIFRTSREKEMTPVRLSEFIQKNETISATRYKPLWDAYNDQYDIYNKKPNPDNPNAPNYRIGIPYARSMTDSFEGFCAGIPVEIDAEDEAVRDYVYYLDSYNSLSSQTAELSTLVSIFGRAYEMYYANEDAELCVAVLSPMESFIIYDEGITPKPLFFVRYYVDSDNVKRGSISDGECVRHFVYNPVLEWCDEPTPHYFDGVPATEFCQSSSRRGLFEGVLAAINAVNDTISNKANDISFFSNTPLFINGVKVDPDQLNDMINKRILNIYGRAASDVDVKFLSKPSNDKMQENFLDRMDELIYSKAMVADITDENFGTTSGIALKYKLMNMSNLAKTKERMFTAGFARRYKLLFSHPVSAMPADAWVGITYRFTLNYPVDIAGEADAVSALSGIVSRRKLLQLLSFVSDEDAELEQIAREADPAAYGVDFSTDRTGGDTK